MTLGDTGQILITQAAAREYAEARRVGVEAARREITVLLAAARRTTAPRGDGRCDLEGWRARSRPLGIDISAHVSREPGLAVVTHVGVRHYGPRK